MSSLVPVEGDDERDLVPGDLVTFWKDEHALGVVIEVCNCYNDEWFYPTAHVLWSIAPTIGVFIYAPYVPLQVTKLTLTKK